jgi:hypothetical protein
MSTAVQLRRGSTAQHSSFTGAVGEVTVDTDKDTIVVHDSSTAGGHPLLKEAAVDTTVAGITSSTGSLKLPSGTQAERDGSPVAGYIRFDEDTPGFEGYNGTEWGAIGGGGGATGGGNDAIFYENGQTVTTSYSLTTGNNAMSTGPITVNSGVAVTVPSGSRWAII